MLQSLWLSSNVSKLNLQGRLKGRRPSNIADRNLVITRFVSSGIDYMRNSSSELTFRMNHMFLSIIQRMKKHLPKMLLACSIRHGSRAENMVSKIISAMDRVDFGDAPEWLMSAMTRISFSWRVSDPVSSNLSWWWYITSLSWFINFSFRSSHWM